MLRKRRSSSLLSGGTIDDYFGTGLVTKKLAETGKTLLPHVAIQTAASSSAHLTKYSNITDVSTARRNWWLTKRSCRNDRSSIMK